MRSTVQSVHDAINTNETMAINNALKTLKVQWSLVLVHGKVNPALQEAALSLQVSNVHRSVFKLSCLSICVSSVITVK